MWHLGPRDNVLPQAHSAQVCSSLIGKYSVYSHLIGQELTREHGHRRDLHQLLLKNCDRAEQQKLLDQMAILDTCKAKNLVYGSFHPLQNPPMFSVSYPPSLSQVLTAVTSTWPQACIWWIPFFCFQESMWGCRCCISRVLMSRRVLSGLRQDPWQAGGRLLWHVLSCQGCLWLRQIFKHKILFKINSR